MNKLQVVNEWLTLLANFGVVAGIIFLAIEIRQNQTLLEQSQILMQREYDLQVADALQAVSDGEQERNFARAQDAELMQLWLDGLKGGTDFSEVELYRFGAMCGTEIWQAATLIQRHVALGRDDLAKAEYVEFRRKIDSFPGMKSCWESNLAGLRRWGFDFIIEEVAALPSFKG